MTLTGISNSVTKVSNFNKDAGGKGAYIAEDADALNQAFTDIASSILATLGVSDIQMTDGITELTQTVEKSGLTISDGKFTYWKKAKGTEDFVEWDPSSENCQEAEYDKTSGAVKWNMGTNFMLEDGVTYKVTWKVWPSQEAYDILAKCKNDPTYYDTLTDGQKAQIIRMGTAPNYSYTLKTNEPNANTTYKSATKTSSGITTEGERKELKFSDVYHPMVINNQVVNLIKVDTADESDYTIDGKYYKALSGDAVLTAKNERRSNLNISKTVVDKDGKHVDTDQSFTFTVTVNEEHDDEVWFSAVDTATN